MKRSFTVAAIAAAAAVVLVLGFVARSVASPSAARAGTVIPLLRMGWVGFTTGAINTLNSSRDPSYSGTYIAGLGVETLTSFTPSGKIKPWLAESVTNPTPSTYVYHLRRGVKFWDGNEMTSADVVYSLNYERAPASIVHGFAFPSVKSVKAAGPYTVIVTLRQPDPTWLQESSIYRWEGIFEKRFFEAHRATYGQPRTLVMGTGPWRPLSLDPTTGAELGANPHWWGGKVPIQHISIKFFQDENSEALAFRGGAIDLVWYITDPRGFAGTAKTQVITKPTPLSETMLSMNTQVAPWNDVHVRRAVAYAIDRLPLVNALGGTKYLRPINTLIDPLQLGTIASKAQVRALIESVPLYPFSVAKAKLEMAKSAYPTGFSADLVEPAGPNLVAQALVAELKPIGINLTIKSLDAGAYYSAITGPVAKRPLTLYNSGAYGVDPSGWDIIFKSESIKLAGNPANYVNPTVDALVKQEESILNPAKRLAIFKKIVYKLQSDLPYIALYSPNIAVALSSKFSWPTLAFYNLYNLTWPLEIKAK
jgi:peptide/nickel transport system substrate-binding protein